MALSWEEQTLIDGLQVFEVSRPNQVIVFLILQTDEQKMQMVDYLLEHRDATEQEILTKAQEISGERTP